MAEITATTKIKTVPSDVYLKILVHNYNLLDSPELVSKCNACGVFNGYDGTITLDKSLPPSFKYEVMLHEVVEALNYHLELELEHRQITAIAMGFAAFLIDNTDLVMDAIAKAKQPLRG